VPSGSQSALYEASYGGVRLDIVAMADAMSRRVSAHRPTRGQGALLQNRGRDERRTRCTVEFFDRGGGDDPLARRRAFLALASGGKAQLFTHPVDGTWPARIGWFIAIMVLGNFAMAFYMLKLLFTLDEHATAGDILLRKPA